MTKNVVANRNLRIAGMCLVFSSPAAQTGESVFIRLADLIRLVEPWVENIYIITNKNELQDSLFGSRVRFVGNVTCPNAGEPILSTILGELKAQVKTVRNLMLISSEIDVILWRGRSSTFVMPLLMAKMKGKKSILLLESKGSELVGKAYNGPLGMEGFILSRIYAVVQQITYYLSNMLVVNVPKLLEQPWIDKHRNKVFPYPVTISFVNSDFKILGQFNERSMIVGYIGRMSQEKGVLNLIKAIPLIQSRIFDIKFFLGGGGPLLREIETALDDLISLGQVEVLDWIPHAELPSYLNRMRLLVLPSYYEGLPAIILEAMACGTPVLASPVGTIPNIIKDGETGFIMEENTPECIAENIIKVLGQPNLDEVSQNARDFVKARYSYETVAEQYRMIIGELARSEGI